MVDHLRLASSDRESLDATEPEDDRLCDRCGHALDFHRTVSYRCTYEVPVNRTECEFCGGKIHPPWDLTDRARCLNCGARLIPTKPCGCDLTPRVVEP